jgi:hypothetical protein
MRALLIAAPMIALAALAGCGAGNGAARNEIREALVNSCLAESGLRRAPPGFDWDRFCGCVTNGVMEGKSTSELKAGPPPADARRAVVNRCMSQMGYGAPARR